MRSIAIHTLACGLLLAAAGIGRAADDTKAIIDKAIKAHGGADNLDKGKGKAAQTKNKGTLEVMGISIGFTEETTVQPDRLKSETELDVAGQTIKLTTVYDGKKAWIHIMGETKELEGKALEEIQEMSYMGRLSRFTALKDKPYEVSSLGEIKVNNRPAVGIKIASKGHKDVNFFFDKETGLLAKIERQGVDPTTEKEFTEERIITEYQEKDGVKVAKKAVINRDGKKFLDVEVLEVKSHDKFEDSEFAKP